MSRLILTFRLAVLSTYVIVASAVRLFLLTLMTASAANALIIDSFDSGAAFEIQNLGSGATLTQPANVLGGTRTVSTTDRVEFDPSIGLDFVLDPPIAANGFVEITYNLGGLNLTPNGVDDGSGAYQVTFERVNDRPATGTATFVILADGAQSVVNGAQEGVVLLPLSRGDPTDVDVLTLKFQPTESVAGDRFRITDFRIIPEPSTALLFSLGLLGIAAIRRRSTAA
jgi:hypothetical protein